MSKISLEPDGWFAQSLARAQRIDAFNHMRSEMENENCPILVGVFEDFAYGHPPFDGIIPFEGKH